MSIITSPEFLINMKSIPKKGDREFEDFLRNEREKLLYGLTINGIYVSNWLYWHINDWKTTYPRLDPRNGQVINKFDHPPLRDNEWMVAELLEKAKKEKKGALIVGGRRIAKTSWVSSWLSLHATMYEGSQNVIVGNNKGDIRNITLQMDKGLSGLEDFLRQDRLLDDWDKEVELGWKEKKVGGKRLGWSNIYIRNTEEGRKTEVLAGITPNALVYDEIGKAPTKEVFLAGQKAFASPYGWLCVPILTGTGGDFTRGKDAEEMFHDPERFNLLAIEVPNENRKTGIFIPGNYATDYPKKEVPLSEYLNADKGTELDNITIRVTQWELSNRMIDEELEKWQRANDQKEYLKALMYAPRKVDDCFLSNIDENPFPVEALKKHLDFLTRVDGKPIYVRLRRDLNNKIVYEEVIGQKPIMDYPVKKETLKDAPVVLYEEPMPNAPDFLYIAGGDPYNQSQSVTSPSLGTIYVYKKIYDPVAGTFQRRIVASYSARPDDMKKWHEIAEMLLELYNATCMIENIGTNFIQYLENKNKAYYLADGYNLAKEINYRSNAMVGKMKGLPATTGVQNHYKNLIIQYLTEPIIVGLNTETNEPIEVLGLTRIPDPMLIIELINFRETEFRKGGGMKKKGNFDRYVSFGHVLAYEEYLEKIAPIIKIKPQEEVSRQAKPKEIRSPFMISSSDMPIFETSSNPFGI